MDIERVFGTDERLESDGVWFDLGATTNGDQPARIKLARIGSREWEAASRRKTAKYGRRGRRLGPEVEDRITVELLAETVVKGWENISRGGEPIPFSAENALELLQSFKDFREFVASAALEMEAYRQEANEDAAKNSKSSSAGPTAGEKKKNG